MLKIYENKKRMKILSKSFPYFIKVCYNIELADN